MLGDVKKKIGKEKSPKESDIFLLSHKDVVRFALFCAYQCEDSWKGIPEECRVAIEVAERWLERKVTAEECKNADYAAYAAYAAYATNKEKVIEKQWEYYNELLHFDEIAEKSLLGG